jgi:hypothetical protein
MCLPNAFIKIKWRKMVEPINPALACVTNMPAANYKLQKKQYENLDFCKYILAAI